MTLVGIIAGTLIGVAGGLALLIAAELIAERARARQAARRARSVAAGGPGGAHAIYQDRDPDTLLCGEMGRAGRDGGR